MSQTEVRWSCSILSHSVLSLLKNKLYIASDTLTSSPGAVNILMFVIEQLVLLDLQKHICIGSSSIEKKIISR